MKAKKRQASKSIRMSVGVVGEGDLEKMQKELDDRTQEMTSVLTRVAWALVICFVPYLAWMQYYYLEFPERIGENNRIVVHSYEVIKNHYMIRLMPLLS